MNESLCRRNRVPEEMLNKIAMQTGIWSISEQSLTQKTYARTSCNRLLPLPPPPNNAIYKPKWSWCRQTVSSIIVFVTAGRTRKRPRLHLKGNRVRSSDWQTDRRTDTVDLLEITQYNCWGRASSLHRTIPIVPKAILANRSCSSQRSAVYGRLLLTPKRYKKYPKFSVFCNGFWTILFQVRYKITNFICSISML